MHYITFDDDSNECAFDIAVRRAAAVAAPVFKANNWTWWESDTPPTADRIYELLRSLVDECIDRGPGTAIATGRFSVRNEAEYDGNKIMGDPEITISLYLGHIYGQ